MEQNSNYEIFTTIVVGIAVFQIVLLFLAFLIWYKMICRQGKTWTLAFLAVTVLYLTFVITSTIDLHHQENLQAGGITFAFEMLNFIYGGIYLGVILLIAVLSKSIKKGLA